MPFKIRVVTRIQDQDDFSGPLTPGRYLKYDGSNFVLDVVGVVDTKSNILSRSSDPVPTFALATDTREIYVWDGTNWNVLPLEVEPELAAPDMGAEEIVGRSDKAGYGRDYISDKALYFCRLGSGGNDEEGAIRLVDGVFQIYANGTWNDVVINFRLREDPAGGYQLEHKPIGFEYWYEVMSGNSDKIGIDGKPIVRQYSTDMGAYQRDVVIDGGTF